MVPTRRKAAAHRTLCVLAACLGALSCSACGVFGSGTPTTTTQPLTPAERLIPSERAAVAKAEAAVGVRLPTVLGQPAPALGADAFARPLRSHQVVGFLPYWEVGSFTPDYQDLTTVIYWSVPLGPDGFLLEDNPGWSAATGDPLAYDIREAHAAGDTVLLTVSSTNASVLHSVATHPFSAGGVLANRVAPMLTAYHFDGVNLDLEGDSTAERDGFALFVASFSKALRAIDPAWSIMIDTYPTSAFDPLSFFDIKALEPYVNEFFVMGYDMDNPNVPSANAPLTNASISDVMALAEYAAVVPGQRIILGIPLYGVDFAATSRFDGALTVGTPVAVTYADIVAAGHKPLWDPVTETPWTVFRRAGKWHQTWFDDPMSIALKAALAAEYHCAGVGVWDLGMSGSDASISAALLGGSAPVKLPLASS
ncbi:MAG: glycosyl hydrolase family 18 protein [Acidimicrobiales bacterium]|jgi:hypothetical protein